jgi:hypothetical protein
MFGVGGAVDAYKQGIYDLAKLNTPKDLYYSTRSTPLITKMNSFIKKAAEDSASSSNTFKAHAATQSVLNSLNTEANATR